jgi:hypothetical protein
MSGTVSFATSEEFVRSVLPGCLDPAPEPTVSVAVMAFMDWRTGVPSVAMRDRAAAIGINAVYDGEEGSYYLTVIESDEVNVEKGREFWGMPKKLGAVDFFDDGTHLYAYVERKARSLVELQATLGEMQQVEPSAAVKSAYFELKAYIAPNGMEVSKPQLVIFDVASRIHRAQDLTDVDLKLGQSPFDPGVATIAVGEFRGGSYLAGVDDYQLREVVELEGDPNDYAPYILGRMYSTADSGEKVAHGVRPASAVSI